MDLGTITPNLISKQEGNPDEGSRQRHAEVDDLPRGAEDEENEQTVQRCHGRACLQCCAFRFGFSCRRFVNHVVRMSR
jgi:hypothetical protein